jgi:hypothetical protein
MLDGGKKSKPRPFSVAQREYETRWDAIFGRDLKEDHPEDNSVLEAYNNERLVSKFDKLEQSK